MNRLDFPYEYVSTGYFRLKSVPKGEKSETLHGMQVVEWLQKQLEERKYYIIGFLVKDGSGALVNKRIFHDEAEARAWTKTQKVPEFAHCFYIECFGSDGTPEWSQGITNE